MAKIGANSIYVPDGEADPQTGATPGKFFPQLPQMAQEDF